MDFPDRRRTLSGRTGQPDLADGRQLTRATLVSAGNDSCSVLYRSHVSAVYGAKDEPFKGQIERKNRDRTTIVHTLRSSWQLAVAEIFSRSVRSIDSCFACHLLSLFNGIDIKEIQESRLISAIQDSF